jgi:hypothetical protein
MTNEQAIQAWQDFIWIVETTGQCVIAGDMEEWAENGLVTVEDLEGRVSGWHPPADALARLRRRIEADLLTGGDA